MDHIMNINGKVKYPITLDPGTWIFDDRKVDLTSYFSAEMEKETTLEEYTKAVSKHWDREIMEGAVFPPTLKSEKKFLKEKLLNGTFGIPFKPFLQNSEPVEDADILVIIMKNDEIEISLMEGYKIILGFSDNGKPLTADGPVHVYFGDGSNRCCPIKNVVGFVVK